MNFLLLLLDQSDCCWVLDDAYVLLVVMSYILKLLSH